MKQEEEGEADALATRPQTPASMRSTRSTTRTVRKKEEEADEGPSYDAEQKPPTRKKTMVKKELQKTTLPSPSLSSSRSPKSSPEEAAYPPQTQRPKRKSSTSNEKGLLQARKLKSHSQYANKSPFPTFVHPTPTECHLALQILSDIHGPRQRPATFVAPSKTAGCGDCPSVLDALVRTILSQNTSGANSTRAKLSMDQAYGRSDDWESIVERGRDRLEDAIRCGGLANVKSKVILGILEQVHAKYGRYSLDHLHDASTDDAYKEMLSFQGVGPKTASCVLLFCLRRESFAVDTHVWRISGLLGWRPRDAGREATQAHLDVRVPDEDKYGLHVLMVTHGKRCEECRAGGRNVGKCQLRRAFTKRKEKEEDAGMVKEEDEKIKVEEDRDN
jgi:endonuclease III